MVRVLFDCFRLFQRGIEIHNNITNVYDKRCLVYSRTPHKASTRVSNPSRRDLSRKVLPWEELQTWM